LASKEIRIKALGEVVCLLILGVDLVDLELLVIVMAPEPMELEQEVLGAVGDPLVHSKMEGPLIVLVTTESLAQKWQIGLNKAQATLFRATTQTGLRKVINPLAPWFTRTQGLQRRPSPFGSTCVLKSSWTALASPTLTP
jgi:hypothetical protein